VRSRRCTAQACIGATAFERLVICINMHRLRVPGADAGEKIYGVMVNRPGSESGSCVRSSLRDRTPYQNRGCETALLRYHNSILKLALRFGSAW